MSSVFKSANLLFRVQGEALLATKLAPLSFNRQKNGLNKDLYN
jgi:hypothetical protein